MKIAMYRSLVSSVYIPFKTQGGKDEPVDDAKSENSGDDTSTIGSNEVSQVSKPGQPKHPGQEVEHNQGRSKPFVVVVAVTLVVPERKTNSNGSDESGPDRGEHQERDDIGDATLDGLVADLVAAVVFVGDALAVEPDAVCDHTQLCDGRGETEAQEGEHDGAEERHSDVGLGMETKAERVLRRDELNT